MLKALLALVAVGVFAHIHTIGPPGRVAGFNVGPPPGFSNVPGIDGGGGPAIHDRKPTELNDTAMNDHGSPPRVRLG